ncbi:MAG: hypothetical protein ACQEUZ_04980, partial [Pseudomonadota bacterium]
FAHNGAQWSAPAFVSVAFPPRQRRSWDKEGRLEMVDYDAIARQDEYSDPWLYPLREWRDVYRYDENSRSLGWTRSGEEGFARFTRHGARVVEEDDRGRPVRARIMNYPILPGEGARRRVVQTPRPQTLLYEYEGPQDRQGVASPERTQ